MTGERFSPEALKQWRISLGLTQKEASAALGITRRQYGRFEVGASPIDLRTTYACRYLQHEACHPVII
jgi:transcriptional regulator with XRE-family HTH domain